jgi:hypothetical protein
MWLTTWRWLRGHFMERLTVWQAAGGAARLNQRLWVAVILAGLTGSAHAAQPIKLDEFIGYWAGTGQVTMTNGSSEQLKCVATYKAAGLQLRQNLRCASAGYSISAAVDLTVTGQSIAGTWEEKTYSANGLITGQVTADGFALAIKGPTFTAEMGVAHSACKQNITIVPTGVDVIKISIALGKC